MKTLPIYQVDAFTDRLFGGNPAAVCPLETWLEDALLQSIAAENNLAETAFFLGGEGRYQLRWFTPKVEVALCGHATLASAHVIFRFLEPEQERLSFESRSGELLVTREGEWLTLDFPALPSRIEQPSFDVAAGLRVVPNEVRIAREDVLVVLESAAAVLALEPDMAILSAAERGVIVTAAGRNCDFVSRFFAPGVGIPEDPVTGSAHCALVPYWAERLGKTELLAHQASERGGVLRCRLAGERVLMSGQAVLYLEGRIWLK